MGNEAKQRICDAAIRLFNEQGYGSVSLRQIAVEAGTSIGNLTYHFSKKDDLMRAILSDLHSDFSEQLIEVAHGADGARRIVNLALINEHNQEAYPFYFANIAQILSQSESLRNESDLFAARLYAYYRRALEVLWDDGWIRNDLDRSSLEVLAYAMVQMESGWADVNAPHSNPHLPTISVSQAICHLLSAYMSEEHLTEFSIICREMGAV